MQKNDSERYFCEIIQMVCPYSHDCSVCRLHNDYETARKKSAEMMKNSGKRLSNAGWI